MQYWAKYMFLDWENNKQKCKETLKLKEKINCTPNMFVTFQLLCIVTSTICDHKNIVSA